MYRHPRESEGLARSMARPFAWCDRNTYMQASALRPRRVARGGIGASPCRLRFLHHLGLRRLQRTRCVPVRRRHPCLDAPAGRIAARPGRFPYRAFSVPLTDLLIADPRLAWHGHMRLSGLLRLHIESGDDPARNLARSRPERNRPSRASSSAVAASRYL
jgi:hypothetical protein